MTYWGGGSNVAPRGCGPRDAGSSPVLPSLLLLLLLGACSVHSYPKPANPFYHKIGDLWYCQGNDPWVWGAGKTFVDDPCRPDACGDMKMPEAECLGLGKVIQ